MFCSNLLSTKSGILFTEFEKEIEGKEIRLFVINNGNGMEAAITNFGLRLVSLLVPDKNGIYEDIVLGHKTIDEYIDPKNEYYIGAVVGRYANRIIDAKFSLEGQEFILTQNNLSNHLHGGNKGFHRVVWNANQISENEIEFSYLSGDMEEGYPGNLKVTVNYKLTEDNELEISYYATTDKTTIINLTNHSYFNLAGEGRTILQNHLLHINADHYTPINKSSAPVGMIVPVDNTPFDFRIPKAIGDDMNQKNTQLQYGNGYDHNYVLNQTPVDNEGLRLVAKVEEPDSGRMMEVFTNKPGVQFYTGNFLDGTTKGKNGALHKRRTGFCLETQHFPNAPNQANFPSVILKSNEVYRSKSVYKFCSNIK